MRPSDCADTLLEAFPHLGELYPLERFLGTLLTTLEEVVGRSPCGCFVPASGHLAVRRDGRALLQVVREGTGAEPLDETAAVRPARFGSGVAVAALAGSPELRALPCAVLSRAVGFLLVPAAGRKPRELDLLRRLAAFYLQRHEIECRIAERFGRELVIMGCGPWIFELQEDLERYAPLAEPVLVLGETGSGKEIFAEAVHVLSPRRAGPFVAVNCAAAPSENLLLDEFFGHRKGAFTGADYDKDGCCQEADGGTLFLDEIGDMSHHLQTLLLRALTTGEVRRIGDAASRRIDLRLVSATHSDLLAASRQRAFRSDLFYRISAFQLRIPPLRERRTDLPFLCDYILHRFAEVNGVPKKPLTEAARARIASHSWPGNVRELENVLKRASVHAGEAIHASDLRFDAEAWSAPSRRDLAASELRAGRSFWDAVAAPLMRREMTHAEVKDLLEEASRECAGGLKALAARWNVPSPDYARFVAFLHRHGLRSVRRGVRGAEEPDRPARAG